VPRPPIIRWCVGQPVIDPERGKKTLAQGASTSVIAATGPLPADIGGAYLKGNDVSPLDEPRRIDVGAERYVPADVVPHAIDPQSARGLWEPE
jgi:hypothetical protein